jgi:hypothetical protein
MIVAVRRTIAPTPTICSPKESFQLILLGIAA